MQSKRIYLARLWALNVYPCYIHDALLINVASFDNQETIEVEAQNTNKTKTKYSETLEFICELILFFFFKSES